jgi:AraC-like DNA-binding protein
MKQSILSYCNDNTLILPQSLYHMTDAHLIMSYNEASVFYKKINYEMRNIEFFTNNPCFIYVENGEETFTHPDGDQLILKSKEMLLIPKNTFMLSDFQSEHKSLIAYIIFFDQSLIKEFLKKTNGPIQSNTTKAKSFKMPKSDHITSYIEILKTTYEKVSPSIELLKTKLLELLFLLDTLDNKKNLRPFLTAENEDNTKRNIKYIMKEHANTNLSIKDLALISGRSQSSFNRDFKRQYGCTPNQWLKARRLEKAYTLIKETSLSITEIGLEIGYENTSHFIKAFKEKYGHTPKQMRLENLC